jgi:HEAT repeat protein
MATVEQLLNDLHALDMDVRREAARWLGASGDARAIEPLHQVARQDPWPSVRAAAAGALVQLGDLCVLGTLRELLRGNVFSWIKIEVIQHLLAYGRRGAAEGQEALALLSEAMQDPQEAVRCRTARALGNLGQAETAEVGAVLTILSEAMQDQEGTVRERAAQALGDLGRPEAAEVLMKALSDPYRVTVGDPPQWRYPVREQAARSLLPLRLSALAPLVQFWGEKSFLKHALAVLSIASEEGVRRLLAALEQISPPWRLAIPTFTVSETEAFYGTWDLCRLLVALGEGPQGDVALPSARDALRWFLQNHPSLSVQEAAVEGLGRAGNVEDVPCLVEALISPVVNVRHAAARALRPLLPQLSVETTPQLVDWLLVALESNVDNALQIAACEALGRIGDERARPALRRLARTLLEAPAVRRAAREALRAIESRPGFVPDTALSRASSEARPHPTDLSLSRVEPPPEVGQEIDKEDQEELFMRPGAP